MLRETNVQRLHWADKTMSMLQRDQLEACEKRLADLPDVSIFDLQNDLRTEELWSCSYDSQEHPRITSLHSAADLRAGLLATLSAEAALLSIEEHLLIERLISLDGVAELIDWEEVTAAESLARRLWCTITRRADGHILVHLPQPLLTPLTLTVSSRMHQEIRGRLLTLDAMIRASLCTSGLLHYRTPLHHLMTDVLEGTYACDLTLAMRFIRANYDYTYDQHGDLILLHPGLADPQRLMQQQPPLSDLPMQMDAHAMHIAMYGMMPEEQPLAEAVLCQLCGAVRPEFTEHGAVEDLLILARQGVSLQAMQEVLCTLLTVHPSEEMRCAVAEMHARTPRWGAMRTVLMQ